MIDAHELKARYLALVADWCEVRVEHGHLRVSLPYLDNHGDAIEAYLVPAETGLLVTDYGTTMGDLFADGAAPQEGTRRFDQFVRLASENGFRLEDGQLLASATDDTVPAVLHTFAHLKLFCQGFALTVQRPPHPVNAVSIAQKLHAYSIAAALHQRIVGKRGITHLFDLVWDRPDYRVLARATGRPDVQYAERFAFAVQDMLLAEGNGYHAVAFVPPDRPLRPDRRAASILHAFDIRVITTDRLGEAVEV